MEQKITVCEMCKKEARTTEQKRHDNWIHINGGATHGVSSVVGKAKKKGAEFYAHGWLSITRVRFLLIKMPG